VVGAAHRINLGRRTEVERLRLRIHTQRQSLAWKHYDTIGEVKYAFGYFGSALSRVRLYAAYTPDDRDGPPVPIGSLNLDRDLVTAARWETAKFDTAHGGQPGLMRALGLNLAVAGDMYLIEINDQLGIYSTEQIDVLGPSGNENDSGIRIKPRRNMTENEWIKLPKDTFIARIWRPHPAWTEEADSSLMGVALSCEELLMLSRMIRASAMSQINAGLLYVAEELSFQRASEVGAPEDDDPDNPATEDDDDAFESEFVLHMTEPVDDELSASSVLPLLVRGPADMAETAIKKVDLNRPFDEQAVKLREDALDRLLNGLDIPKDLVTGFQNVRYSNAQQISENLYKAHVEPAAVLACEALTVTRLRPALIARGIEPDKVARCTIWYDASEVVAPANRSEDADSGWDRILISDQSWRRDHGYSEADAPDDEEVTRRLAQKSPLAPESAIQMLSVLMPVVGEMVKAHVLNLNPAGAAAGQPTGKTIDARALPGRPGTVLPQDEGGGVTPPPEGSPAPSNLVAAGGVSAPAKTLGERELKRLLGVERNLRASLQTMLTDMTERALEKAGSRLVSKLRDKPGMMAKVRNVPKSQVAAVLGPQAVTAAGYTEQQLVNDALDQAGTKYVESVTQAQASAAKVLGIDAFGELADVTTSWSVLKPMLAAFMLKAMFRQETDGYLPKVPMDDVRLALARAGGANPQRPTQVGPQPGAALNDRSVELLSEKVDGDPKGYRWVYGISDNHFQPHLDLDGLEFSTWQDEVLANSHPTFPKSRHYYPGDHTGCECDVLPMIVPRQPHEGQQVEHHESAA
jgi:hypothetical protein